MASLDDQPNDHLTVIMRFLDGQSLKRCQRVSHRLARFAVIQWPETCALHTARLRNIETVVGDHLLFDRYPSIKACMVPGVTEILMGDVNVTDQEVCVMLTKCGPELLQLEFRHRRMRTPFQSLMNACKRLEVLKIRAYNCCFDEHGMIGVPIGASLKHLEFSSQPINDDTMLPLATSSPNLETLRLIENSDTITDRSLIPIFRGCRKLKSVSLTAYKGVTDLAYLQLAKSCPELVKLFAPIGDLLDPNNVLEHLGRGCPLLDQLNLSVGSRHSTRVVHPTPLTTHFPNLIVLILRWTGRTIDDELVRGLSQGCPKLERLLIPYSIVTDEALPSLLSLPLKYLGLSSTDVTERALEILGGLPSLVYLDLLGVELSPRACRMFRQLHPGVQLVSDDDTIV